MKTTEETLPDAWEVRGAHTEWSNLRRSVVNSAGREATNLIDSDPYATYLLDIIAGLRVEAYDAKIEATAIGADLDTERARVVALEGMLLELEGAAHLAAEALDALMGDSDLDEDDSLEFRAMQALTSVLAPPSKEGERT